MKDSITPIIRGGILGSDMKYLVVRERVQNKVVSIKYIENKFMLTNTLTKGLPPNLVMNYVAHMGFVASLSVLD